MEKRKKFERLKKKLMKQNRKTMEKISENKRCLKKKIKVDIVLELSRKKERKLTC